ncbi:MAG: hypothetical protein IKM73_15425 [Acidaminococcaceae bacterium]|nr:hypothetical protein [Acidaminococcaceae bacterium]
MSVFNFVGTAYFIFVPLAAGIPFSGGLGEHGTLGYNSILLSRCSKKRLIAARTASSFIIGALMAVLPAAANLLWCVIAFPLNTIRNPINAISSMPIIDFFLNRIYLKDLYISHPYLYSTLGLASLSIYGGTCALAASTLSLIWDSKRFLIGTVPFVLVLLISLAEQTFGGLIGGASGSAPVYAYFITADDSLKLPIYVCSIK